MNWKTTKRTILRNLSNLPGWRTDKKLIVIESDDWGAIRMSSAKSYATLYKAGVKPSDDDEERYLKNDGLASENDLSGLFEVLSSVKDANNNPAVFTALSLSANPVFEAIEKNGFEEYVYEPFPETLKRYPLHARSFELWKEGQSKRLFVPQFHGREHLNVLNWLKALKTGEKDTLLAFKEQVYGITPRHPVNHVSYQAAFDVDDTTEIDYHKQVIKEGLQLFESLHGYKATFFITPNGPFNNSLEQTIIENGIRYIGANRIQEEPVGEGKIKKHFHYLGQRNKYGQRYLTRNCFFEPSSNLQTDWVDTCMKDVAISFRWNKPVILSSHRVNYIGWINPANRDKGLSQLKALLSKIVKTWPDAAFITSDQLGDLIAKG